MSKDYLIKTWKVVKKRISAILIVSMLLANLNNFSMYAKETIYQFVQEVEIDELLVDDGMFYMPHKVFEVKENEFKGKYLFKVKRKGDASKTGKVKLTMIDMSGKYDRDYSIRIIDKGNFSEKVQNKSVSKSMEEYMKSNKYEEYNYSDAIIDGSIDLDNIMTDEEKDNYVISDEEKESLANDAKNLFNKVIEGTDAKEDNEKDIVEPTSKSKKLNGFVT